MSEIKKLSDYQHARLRTEMYLGSRAPHIQTVFTTDGNSVQFKEFTWVPAVFTAFREILDNALDEVIGHGFGNRIDIFYYKGSFSVKDNGRGIPITFDESHNCHLATLTMTEARAGRNFGERGEVAGTNGIGASVVNFCSEKFTININRDNKEFKQNFSEGTSLDDSLQIGKVELNSRRSSDTGTYVFAKLSKEVFNNMELPEEFVHSRIIEIAHIHPNVKFYFNGERIKVNPKGFFKKPITVNIEEEAFSATYQIVPNFMTGETVYHSIVNNIPAFNGGTQIDTFRLRFFNGILNALEKESRKRKLQPNRSDVGDGVLIYNVTKMKAPNFDSQSKTRLINEEVSKIVNKALNDEEIFRNIVKKNREWIEEIYQRCAERTMKKDASELAKAAKKNLRIKVAKLIDANSKDRSKCRILLGEGDSACGGASQVRNPETDAMLPLRGKVMNVHGESPKKVLDNKELSDIMTAVGLQIGVKANPTNLRFGKIYLATDADPDGANIAALLVNFFYTYWPELFESDYINVFNTPFVILEKGKERKYYYSYNYSEFDPSNYKGWTITRAKGLGTLQKEDWKFALDNPNLTPIIDDGNLKDSLDLIFNGSRANDRKEWIGI